MAKYMGEDNLIHPISSNIIEIQEREREREFLTYFMLNFIKFIINFSIN